MSDSSYRPYLISPGTRLNGIYEIDQAIGSGGMGEIYRGHAIQTGDAVAIKMIRPELAENEAALALFRKEASALHNLHHEAIVRYYVFTIEPTLQRPYLAMEFVDGQPLSDLLKSGRLAFEAVRRLMQRVAGGLQAAHERGIIHRDVSPDNIIIPDGDVGRSKIIDFGIARSTKLADGTVIGGGFAGKYNYVSPEQLGLFGGDVTAKSDIYSLGLVLVEALAGQAIDMGGSQLAIIEKRRKVPDLGAIDMRWRPLLERMLQPDPANRPESMAAVAAWPLGSLHRVEAPGRDGVATRDHSSAPRALRKWRYALAAAAAALTAGAGASLYVLQQPPPAAQAPPPPALPVASSAPSMSSERPPPSSNSAQAPPPAPTAAGQAARPSPSRPAPPVLAPPPTGSESLALNAPQLPQLPSSSAARPEAPALSPPSVTPAIPASPTLPMSPGRADKVKQYIDGYEGGECFFIWPVAVSDSRAVIEGFGASAKPFETLDSAFQRENGFEASIGVREVTEAQCPAITFLAKLRAERARAPHIELATTNLKSGDVLSGTIDGYGSRAVELLLVSDSGSVQNVSKLLKPGTDAKTFSIGLQRTTGPAGPQPQLLVAVASTQPLEVLRPGTSVPAEKFFAQVLSETSRSGHVISAAAKYFRLDR
jgi:serine/threonine protein kinase